MQFEQFGQGSTRLVFCHANGFPPATYRRLFAALGGGVEAALLAPLTMPVTEAKQGAWWLMAEDLAAWLSRQPEPVVLAGHSMGAVVACLASMQCPDRVAGLVMLDPVFLPTRWVAPMRLMPKRFKLKQPMVARTLRRPYRFEDHAGAFEFHRGKRAFAGMDDQALEDYIHAAFVADEQGVCLRYSREWEAHIYQTAPWIWPRLSRLKVPTLAIRGGRSDTVTPASWARMRRLMPDATLVQLPDCGHLLPMERPDAVAEAINAWLERRC
ncbi:Pimeloyl-ACP methyl ester carboxylesterase [Ferrimonas sediminum]|uniref:Pimeloyl-ACP methyl ester carboxylesterase n=1 Tax=Ferrimonas sediminum TaxID=718193 RepID=A0A1G8JPC8_9GAMM|nr:Pimeloyl-ACP methyl ester carboxylesterase [Ferrimonas sediminum]